MNMNLMLKLLISIIGYILVGRVQCQRPLLNHTFNALLSAQEHNYLGSGTKLRNGRVHEMPIRLSTTIGPSFHRGIPMYDDFDTESLTGGRRENRRRLNSNEGRRERGNSRRGIESLRKELMKPSVGGPGGGISGSGYSYPSYSGTSSIGKIDGLGSLGSADRYGDSFLRPAAGLSDSALHSTRFPPQYDVNDDKRVLPNVKKSSNSITELLKLKQQRFTPHGQADEPAGGFTHGTLETDEGEISDPIQAIKDKIRNTAPLSSPYETQTETAPSLEIEDQLGVRCTFETPCAWKWTENLPDGFQVMTGTELAQKNMTGLLPGPIADSVDDANGHFLYARLLPTTAQVNLTSPQFSTTMEKCFLEVFMHQSDMSHGLSRVVVEPLHSQEGSWVPAEIIGENFQQWGRKVFRIGRISRDFRIVFEVVPKLNEVQKAHVAIDNLRMSNCFPEGTKSEKCSTSQIKCQMNKVPVCIPLPRICDITKDCDNSEDELLNCDKIPHGGRCDFEDDWCGWKDSGKTLLSWSRHTGSSPTYDTGPDGDHTYQHLLNTTDGYYMLVDMNQHSRNNTEKGSLIGFASNAVMVSRTFNPPPLVHGNPNSPYRNSCVVRFYIHQFGKNPGSINLSVVEMKETENITTTLWWSTKNQGSDWLRAEYVLPNITSRYYLQFEARMGMRIYSDVAVDDFSLSPECFGINIPEEYLNGYNYWNVMYNLKSPTHRDFEHRNYLELTSCDTRGMIGPTQQQCENNYKKTNNSHVLKEVHVVEDQSSYKGMQKWRVPHEGYYTIIAKGASGGVGSGGVGSSRGAMAISVLELHKNEELYILVGQQGEHACIKSMSFKEEHCNTSDHNLDLSKYNFTSKQHMVRNINIENGAGGGGGASYIFLLNSAKNEAVPLIVAGGGGGLGIGQYIDEDFQHGQKINNERPAVTGQIHGEVLNKKTAGPGGGWSGKSDEALSPKFGAALLQGGRGGHSCYVEIANNGTTINRHGQGGFGGGGGGCYTGGGGGGYAGGDVYLNESNGEGGTSFITPSRSLRDFNIVYEGAHSGTGAIIIIPAIEGCGCDYRCIALDEFRHSVRCICPEGWRIKRDNNTACEVLTEERIPFHYLIGFFIFLVILLGTALTALMLLLYNRYQRARQQKLRHKMLLEQDLQLSRLRSTLDDSNLTNFNPNYGCDGILNGHIDAKNLPQIARESLRLVKPLGQGAFGEVYQGLYRQRAGDAVERAVAVKTLPEMSTKQSEDDFLMEACIMAKFDHPNMVHLIGVCFENHPRFIVLELLAGGDLKNFLRENRNKPERPSPLAMKDLVLMSLDVANGCQYMESKRFIHRDIAARNCLLSSKGPGRVVKIADFGMARDIYRSDYYRKGGKAMLPIKWMPPEAFLDGIFTSKTDVWSFGVLLWEVFSLGLMPYTGLPNPDVMQLVTSGGRLGVPMDCPPRIYSIMTDCWNPAPEKRPSFVEILERLKECKAMPEIMEAPLPHIFRPPSTERDQTVMRPPNGEEYCLSIPHSSDYLIPLPGMYNNGGEYAGTIPRCTIVPNLSANVCTPPVVSSPLAPNGPYEDSNGCWETSFILPNSKSDQPLLLSNNDSQRSGGLSNSGLNLNNNNNNNKTIINDIAVSQIHTNASNTTSEAKLISLDTPQATPTTILPPHSFSTQLDGITLDPAALSKSLHSDHSKQSYANVEMSDAHNHKLPKSQRQNGGIINNGLSTGNNDNGSVIKNDTTDTSNMIPFTIQGFKDRFKDNHSEISC